MVISLSVLIFVGSSKYLRFIYLSFSTPDFVKVSKISYNFHGSLFPECVYSLGIVLIVV